MTTSAHSQQDILSYIVPTLTPDGTCSADKGFEDEPYNLREILGVSTTGDEFSVTQQIQKLYSLLDQAQRDVQADWIGIYHVATNKRKARVLVKLAYRGVPSRAEFPLTKEFAELSNNSTVGLTGQAVVIQSVREHQGSYYNCDSSVNSEACLPIFASNSTEIIGIIDAESFSENHFTDEILTHLKDLCGALSEYLPVKP